MSPINMDSNAQQAGLATRIFQSKAQPLSRLPQDTPMPQAVQNESSQQENMTPFQARGFQDTLGHRRRLQSLPTNHEEDLIDRVRRSLHFGSAEADNVLVFQEKEKRPSGIRGLLRRASVSLKGKTRPRRNSHSVVNLIDENILPRPSTSTWHKLRQATSFRYPPSNSISDLDSSYLESTNSFEASPIPGNGILPPIIPRGFGGTAARATAAFQNEHLERARQHHFFEESQGDGESGVGIAVSVHLLPRSVDTSISRVDFVTQLPVELAIQILSHLDHYGLAQAALVSRNWSRISSNRHIWREAFFREKSSTYAMGAPLMPGSGLGLPAVHGGKPWKDVYKIRHQLQSNWRDGKAKYVCLNGHLDSIYCVQFDEHKIITGSRDKTIRVWNMHTYACELIIGPPGVLRDPGLMVTDEGKSRHFTNMPDGDKIAECVPRTVSFDLHHCASILCLQYDQDILVTGSSDGTCIVYSIKNGYKPFLRLKHHSAAVLDLAFDEKHIVTCSKDVTICVWDRATGDLLRQLRGHAGPVNAVQLRGNTIVSCSGDFTVKLWNIDSGKQIREFSGHTKGLACTQFSEDSRLIASAGNDRIIRIWDANTGECLRQIEAHDNLVRSLHIDSVSGRLVSGSYDQDIKVFDIESGRLLLEFPKWHTSWVLGARSDYRRIISTGQEPKILIMDFGLDIEGIDVLESPPVAPRALMGHGF